MSGCGVIVPVSCTVTGTIAQLSCCPAVPTTPGGFHHSATQTGQTSLPPTGMAVVPQSPVVQVSYSQTHSPPFVTPSPPATVFLTTTVVYVPNKPTPYFPPAIVPPIPASTANPNTGFFVHSTED